RSTGWRAASGRWPTARCATPPIPPRTCWWPTGTGRTRGSVPPTRCRSCARQSTGRPSAASTAATAIATPCAPAPPPSRLNRAGDQQRRDAGGAPPLEIVADLGRRSHQVDVLDHRRGHRRGRIGLAPLEIRLLDLLSLGPVAQPHEDVLVEVA